MIDKRFCTEASRERGPDTEAAQELADLLAEEIQRELHQAIQPALERVIQRLNQLGHHLTLNEEPIPGEVAYRDENNGNRGIPIWFMLISLMGSGE
jgi:hypothetical protein